MRRLQRGERLVLATHNPGKLREIAALLAPFGVDVVSAGALGLGEPAGDGAGFRGECAVEGVGGLCGVGVAGAGG